MQLACSFSLLSLKVYVVTYCLALNKINQMPDLINFYMDDSGTRNPDRTKKQTENSCPDWFALGGILVRQSDELEVREAHEDFCSDWDIKYPLHSSEIRSRSENFKFIETWPIPKQKLFYESLGEFLINLPVIGLACVIDRRGYQARYLDKYGKNRWALCKTAFTVAVERALKYAESQNCKLRVLPERASKVDDTLLKSYFEDLKTNGNPFSNNSSKYAPLEQTNYSSGLYEFKPKNKSSPLAQIADLYLYPICKGAYQSDYKPLLALKEKHKLIDFHIDEMKIPTCGIKYSCFDS